MEELFSSFNYDVVKKGCIGGDVQLVDSYIKEIKNINYKFEGGKTFLHLAVENNNCDIVELLLKHGADINCQDEHGDTPLHYACGELKIDIFFLLVECGANLNIKGRGGFYIINIMVYSGYKNLLEYLLKKNIKLDVMSRSKHYPITDAFHSTSRLHLVELLLKWGSPTGLNKNNMAYSHIYLDRKIYEKMKLYDDVGFVTLKLLILRMLHSRKYNINVPSNYPVALTTPHR